MLHFSQFWLKGEEIKHLLLIHAVLFRDFLDGDANLVAQVPPRVHHAICAFTQNHVVTLLISLVNILLETEDKFWGGSPKKRRETYTGGSIQQRQVFFSIFKLTACVRDEWRTCLEHPLGQMIQLCGRIFSLLKKRVHQLTETGEEK